MLATKEGTGGQEILSHPPKRHMTGKACSPSRKWTDKTFNTFHKASKGVFIKIDPIGDDRSVSRLILTCDGVRNGEGMFFTSSGMHIEYQYMKTGRLSRNGRGAISQAPQPYYHIIWSYFAAVFRNSGFRLPAASSCTGCLETQSADPVTQSMSPPHPRLLS